MIRAWSPVVPHGWSTTPWSPSTRRARRDLPRPRARDLPGGTQRLYATDFHNDRVVVFMQRLLEKYQPVTVMDTNESFTPTAVEAFVADADPKDRRPRTRGRS